MAQFTVLVLAIAATVRAGIAPGYAGLGHGGFGGLGHGFGVGVAPVAVAAPVGFGYGAGHGQGEGVDYYVSNKSFRVLKLNKNCALLYGRLTPTTPTIMA